MQTSHPKRVTVGIMAHVDAGKTTLCESLLTLGGVLRSSGRVDDRTTFFDFDPIERKRGITVSSKMAELPLGDTVLTILDTPGHSDLSSALEETLPVLDYALLVISGTDGIQSHTRTVISSLQRLEIPVFIFISKMDVSLRSREDLLKELNENLSAACVEFPLKDFENAAMTDETLLDEYLNTGAISDPSLSSAIASRTLIPCYFGSGLRLDGVPELLQGLGTYTLEPPYGTVFGARVYKIMRDESGRRLTFAKLTGGELHVRDLIGDEKITEIRHYSGNRYKSTEIGCAGQICALLGLRASYPGQGLGAEIDTSPNAQTDVIRYAVRLESADDLSHHLPSLLEFGEEHPELGITYDDDSGNLTMNLRGKVHSEIIRSLIQEKLGLQIHFEPGQVVYHETITEPAYGIGHYEPLKHYAEVHLLLEPLPPGSGIEICSRLEPDSLDINYVNQVMSILRESPLTGVLTKSALTDIRISLMAGRSHVKHTEGGDFRQATLRALHQALMQSKSVLLEPVFSFDLEIPNSHTGRALSDLHQFHADIDQTLPGVTFTRITGKAPVRKIADYSMEVQSYTSGEGHLELSPGGYIPCEDSDEIISQRGYVVQSDADNTPDSVFCSHGAGVVIPWNEVASHCHIPPRKECGSKSPSPLVRSCPSASQTDFDDQELEEIMLREFGPIRRKQYQEATVITPTERPIMEERPSLTVIDGYNLLHSWEDLKTMGSENLDLARQELINRLANAASFTGKEFLLVFDAYNSPCTEDRVHTMDHLHIHYTQPGQSADAYIERLLDDIGKNYNVRVITSDALIQQTALRSGILRCSSREFQSEMEQTLSELRDILEK